MVVCRRRRDGDIYLLILSIPFKAHVCDFLCVKMLIEENDKLLAVLFHSILVK